MTKFLLTLSSTAFVALALFTATPATAKTADPSADQPTASVVKDNGKYYAGFSVGAYAPKSSYTVEGSVFGYVGEIKLYKQKVGFTMGVKAGVHANDYLATEIEANYARFNLVDINDTKASVNHYFGFVNAVVTPFGRLGQDQMIQIQPELLFGLGGLYEHKLNDKSDLEPAGQAGLRIKAQFNDVASVAVSYKALFTTLNRRFYAQNHYIHADNKFYAQQISVEGSIHF